MTDIKRKSKSKLKGSMLVGVLLVFLMVSAISIVIVSRSIHDAKIAKESRQSYRAYQESDENIEVRLTNIKNLDNENNGYIPENAPVASYCSTSDSCYDFTDTAINPAGDMTVDQIGKVLEKGSEQQTERAIKAPVPARISMNFDALNFQVIQCGNPSNAPGNSCTYNKCDVVVSWDTSAIDDPNVAKEWEIRRSTDNLLTNSPASDYGWWRPPILGAGYSNPTALTNNRILVESDCDTRLGCVAGDDSYFDNGGQYNERYYYTIKVRNKRNFELDSLYYYFDKDGNGKKRLDPTGANTSVKMDNNDDCDDGPTGDILDDLGCIDSATAGSTPGIVPATSEYNCCNGTKCYKPDPDWERIDPDEECSVQKCGLNLGGITDEVGVNPSGSGTLGWCGTNKTCTKSTDCNNPYRKVGYCDTCPGGYPAWTKENWQDVDINVGINDQQARCCSQNCKTAAEIQADYPCGANPTGGTYTNNSYCTKNTPATTSKCGPRTDTKLCNLSCSGVYYVPNPVYNYSAAYPQGTCCYETCPAGPPFNGEASCSTTTYPLPANGISWTNQSTCTSNKCATGTGAGQHGYTLSEKCSLNCQAGYGARNPNTSQPSTACCYHLCSEWISPGCPSNPANGSYTDGHYCSENTCGQYSSLGSCNLECNNYWSTSGYHTENGSTCIANSQTATCGGSLPDNAYWNSGSNTYTRYWYDYGWGDLSGDVDWGYWTSASANHNTSGNCSFQCKTNYSWNGSSCVANTQTAYCSGKPGGTSWYGSSSYTQTWDGDSWEPSYSAYAGSGTCGYAYDCGRCSTWNYNQYATFKSWSSDCSGPFDVVYTFNASCQCGSGYCVSTNGSGTTYCLTPTNYNWNSTTCNAGGGNCTDYGGPSYCGWTFAAWGSCNTRCVDGVP